MATQAEIDKVRLYLDDNDAERDFSNSEIESFIDENNSVNYALLELAKILKVRLRKEILEGETTGSEDTKLASLKSRLDLINDIIAEFQDKWDGENDNTTGRYIASVKPTVAGGDV